MISIKYNGRLGNQIYQYCFGRILSSNLNMDLDSSLDEFDGAGSVYLGRSIHRPQITLSGHVVDINSINPNYGYHLDGYFQRFEYYKHHKEDIKKWLKIEKNYRKPGKEDLVVHVRGGDLYQWNRPDQVHPQHIPLPLKHYVDIIKKSQFKNLFVVCEKSDDPIGVEISKLYNCEIVSQSVIEDFYFIKESKKIVLSTCSLAWWASWISEAEEIHFPLAGFWHPESERNDMDVIVDESRYKYYDLGVNDHWSGTKEELERIKKL